MPSGARIVIQDATPVSPVSPHAAAVGDSTALLRRFTVGSGLTPEGAAADAAAALASGIRRHECLGEECFAGALAEVVPSDGSAGLGGPHGHPDYPPPSGHGAQKCDGQSYSWSSG